MFLELPPVCKQCTSKPSR